MKTFKWDHLNGADWTPEMIMAYNAEQQTLLMQKMADSLHRMERIAVALREEEADKRRIAELAVDLMVQKVSVLDAFADAKYLPFSQARQRLLSRGFRCYGEDLRKAVSLIDYLVAEPVGSGYRIWLAGEYAAAKEAV